MKKKLATVGIAATAVLMLTGFIGGRWGCGGTAEERFDRGQAYAQNRLDDKLDDLEATDAQRARIKELANGLFADARPLALSHQQLKREVAAEFAGDRVDAAKLHAMVDARAAEYQAFAHKVVAAAAEAHSLLTPEQRAELNAEIQKRMERYQ